MKLSLALIGAILVAGIGDARAEGGAQWVSLLEGNKLSHWRGYQQKDVPASWEVRDGSIFCNGKDGAHLITRKKYGDFELTGEWKISKGGNSGILLRVVEVTAYPANSGLEIQVIDHSDGWKEVHGSGLGMGQSAGAAAALAVQMQTSPGAVPLPQIKRLLKQHGAILAGEAV